MAEFSGIRRQSRTTGNEILRFDFAEGWKGERKSSFLRNNSLKTGKNVGHFVP